LGEFYIVHNQAVPAPAGRLYGFQAEKPGLVKLSEDWVLEDAIQNEDTPEKIRTLVRPATLPRAGHTA
jgi:hypothetical protein